MNSLVSWRSIKSALMSLFLISFMSSVIAQQWELKICADPKNPPFSNREKEGFENRIAEIISQELNATLSYVWLPDGHTRARDAQMLREGTCDLLVAVFDGQEPYLTTLPYYQSTYVFVFRKDSPPNIQSLEAPELSKYEIGLPGAASPPELALVNQGLIDNLHHYYPDSEHPNPTLAILEAVAGGTVDIGIVWGPTASYYVHQQTLPLTLLPVTPQIAPPFISMVYPISMGVRKGDQELVDLLNQAIVLGWDDIQRILQDFAIPLLPLPKPVISIEGDF